MKTLLSVLFCSLLPALPAQETEAQKASAAAMLEAAEEVMQQVQGG